MSFNKYEWIQMVEKEIFNQAEKGIIQTEEEAWDLVNSMIDDSVIYTSDCFDIIEGLNYYDWRHSELPVNNVHQAAYNALLDYSIEYVIIEKDLFDEQ